jgi:MarR family transcriptional regulator, transcriptional regulator for hemolysin
MREELESRIAAALPPLTRAWRQVADQTLGTVGISASAAWSLVYLQRFGATARQIDLARAVGVSEPSLVRTLDRLEGDGLIERRPDAEDRRAKRLHLTDKGRALAVAAEARLQALRADLLEHVSTPDLEAMLRACVSLERMLAGRRLP